MTTNDQQTTAPTTHSERCYREATRDAIFLFQRRELKTIGAPDGYTIDEEGEFVSEEETEEYDGEQVPKRLSQQQAFDSGMIFGDYDVPCVLEQWRTESVYLSREEAEEYGRWKHYNYPDGWRVYCVCANGELAKLLKSQDQQTTTPAPPASVAELVAACKGLDPFLPDEESLLEFAPNDYYDAVRKLRAAIAKHEANHPGANP